MLQRDPLIYSVLLMGIRGNTTLARGNEPRQLDETHPVKGGLEKRNSNDDGRSNRKPRDGSL